jgi:KUP system potassium uptake protein
VLAALQSRLRGGLLLRYPLSSFLVLGACSSRSPGGEALYADMGHFGKRRSASPGSASSPALLLNYFGQARLRARQPDGDQEPLLQHGPEWGPADGGARDPRAVIASQAVISGAFSVTRQAIQLGYIPRLEILHTSSAPSGRSTCRS